MKRVYIAVAATILSFSASAGDKERDHTIVAGIPYIASPVVKNGTPLGIPWALRSYEKADREARILVRKLRNARGHNRTRLLLSLERAEQDRVCAVLGVIPYAGAPFDLIYITRALEDGSEKDIVCPSISLASNFVTGGISRTFNISTVICNTIEVGDELREHRGKRRLAKRKHVL